MRANHFCVIVAGLLAWHLASAPRASRAAQGQPGTGGTVPVLHLSAQTMHPGGPGGGEAQVSWALTRDETAQLRIGGGSAEYPELNICGISSGGPEFPPGTLVGWLAEARLLSADAAGAHVKIRWTRRVLQSGAVEVDDVVRDYDVRLTEGARFVLDLVRPTRSTPDCDGIVVHMWLTFSDPAELASEILDYDIWLVHHEADGRETVDRTTGRGLQGKRVEYLFKHLRYSADGRPDPRGEVDVKVGGGVKGRVRPDGLIDVSIGAARMVTHRHLGSGEGGDKAATLRDGETIELELPPHHARGPAFEAQRTSVRVTVRRVGV